ncbi:MAG: hypothetical protein QM718_03105 [Steroidobacteraceae bacterium]
MKMRMPPELATRALKHLCRGPHSESLAGDLIEEYQQGHSKLWYWRQVSVAIVIGCTQFSWSKLLISAAKLLGWLLIEFTVVVGTVLIADQKHHVHTIQDWMNPAALLSLTALIVGSLAGFGACLWAKKQETRLALSKNLLVLLLTVTAAGAGTLVWADTNQSHANQTKQCACWRAPTHAQER